MKKICSVLIILLLTLTAFSQQKKGVVILKNGSIIKGKIQEKEDSENIIIKSSGNLWVFPRNEIDQISYSVNKKRPTDPDKPVSQFSNHTQIGILIGNNENAQSAPFVLHSSLNYKLDDKIQAGIGIGVEFLKETHMPVFANIEYKLRDTYFSPFIFLKAGYCLPIEESRDVYYDVMPYWSSSSFWPQPWVNTTNELNAKGGILFNPGFGVINMFSQNFGISFTAGYRFTRLHYSGEKDYQLDIDFNRLSLKLGIIFN